MPLKSEATRSLLEAPINRNWDNLSSGYSRRSPSSELGNELEWVCLSPGKCGYRILESSGISSFHTVLPS
jgi:hypothetical protein